MREIHRDLFRDIYDGVGQPRVVPERAMTKRGPDVVNHEVGDPNPLLRPASLTELPHATSTAPRPTLGSAVHDHAARRPA
jgi:hypothetical protein